MLFINENNLKPCPFCGNKPIVVHKVHPSGVPGIKCIPCNYIIKADREDKVAGMWNSRVCDNTREQDSEWIA
jgi:Lar family restriction alleviation protein